MCVGVLWAGVQPNVRLVELWLNTEVYAPIQLSRTIKCASRGCRMLRMYEERVSWYIPLLLFFYIIYTAGVSWM